MQSEDAKIFIFELICKDFETHGINGGLATDFIHAKINEETQVKKHGGISLGLLHVCLAQLRDEGMTEYDRRNDFNSVPPEIFIQCYDDRESEIQPETVSEWAPLQVENHTQVADNVDEVAEILSAENGYIADHKIEAEHTITTTKNLSSSLRENEGSVLFKQLNYFVSLMERIITIFDKSTRVGKVVYKLVVFISSLIPK